MSVIHDSGYAPVTNNELPSDGEFFRRFSLIRPGSARQSPDGSSIA